MKPLRHAQPTDLEALQMENELLTYEIRHLRARSRELARTAERATNARTASDEALRKARSTQVELRDKLRQARANKKRAQENTQRARQRNRKLQQELKATRAENQRLRTAEEDMRWFVARLDGSPVGPVLRRRPGFRVLLDRYRTPDA